MKFRYLFILLFSSNLIFAQNQIFLGTKAYSSTSSWNFLPPSRTFSDDGIVIQIGKNGNNGVLLMSVSSEYGKSKISGIVYIYLVNNKVITVSQVLGGDYSDNRISVAYSILSTEIRKLELSNISVIRFTYTNSYGQKMGITARNGQEYFNGVFSSKEREIQTAEEIKMLFTN
jgi:hypothetical protein